MRRFVESIMVLLLWLGVQTVAAAESWTTPDGVLTVTIPETTRLKKLASPPAPLLVAWRSADDTFTLTVMTFPVPANVKLNQAHAEEGLAKELGTPVTRLPNRNVAGHEIWDMSGKFPSGFIRQAIIPGQGTAYKLMALAADNNIDDKRIIDKFIDSVAINPSAAPPRSAPPVDPIEKISVNEVSGRIGAYGVFLLIGIFIYRYFVAKSQKANF